MKKLLVIFLSLLLLGTSLATLTSKEEVMVDQVAQVIEQQIEDGKPREKFYTVLDTVIKHYPQYAYFFSALKDAITPIDSVAADVVSFMVTDVTDGDTITLDNGEKVRLIGVDAPEFGEELGPLSKNFASQYLLNEEIVIEKDETQGDIDMYGRTLAYVWVGDVLFNEYIIKNGYATEYTFANPYKYQTQLQDAEKYAQENNLGVWEEQYSCEAKTYCTQMVSCEEAYYYLNTCELSRLDSDGDGVPCESLCQ